MYLIQAKNLIRGIPLSDTGYIYNPEFARNGPATYPMGYPLLLSPLYAIWGNNMAVFSMFQSTLALLFGLTFFAFVKKHFAWITSIAIVVILVYNPWFLYFKRELMSDIPFAILVLLFLMALRSKKKPWVLGIFAFALILFRGIGWFALPLLILPNLMKAVKHQDYRIYLWQSLGVSAVVTLAVVLTNKWLFNLPMSTSSYSDQLIPVDLLQNVQGNFIYFKNVIADHLFRYWEDRPFLYVAAISTYGLLILIGAITTFRKHPLYTWTILVYGFIILVYPYRYSGFRFIFPIHGLMLFLAATGLFMTIPKRINLKWLMLLAVGFYMSSHIDWWRNIVVQQHLVQPGPQHPDSKEMFSFLHSETDQNEPILFIKPRVMSLYGKRKSVSNEPHGTQMEIAHLIEIHNVRGLITCSDAPHPSLEKYISDNAISVSLKFENDRFHYYHLVTPLGP